MYVAVFVSECMLMALCVFGEWTHADRSTPVECLTFQWRFEVTRSSCEDEPYVSRKVNVQRDVEKPCQTFI